MKAQHEAGSQGTTAPRGVLGCFMPCLRPRYKGNPLETGGCYEPQTLKGPRIR
jgi:hypothetical protein